MTIHVLCETVVEIERAAALIARTRQQFAPNIPEWLSDVRIISSAKQPSSTIITAIHGRPELLSDGLMTRTEAARAIRRHPTTVDRLARRGRLLKQDGRIVAGSVHEYLRGQA